MLSLTPHCQRLFCWKKSDILGKPRRVIYPCNQLQQRIPFFFEGYQACKRESNKVYNHYPNRSGAGVDCWSQAQHSAAAKGGSAPGRVWPCVGERSNKPKPGSDKALECWTLPWGFKPASGGRRFELGIVSGCSG